MADDWYVTHKTFSSLVVTHDKGPITLTWQTGTIAKVVIFTAILWVIIVRYCST